MLNHVVFFEIVLGIFSPSCHLSFLFRNRWRLSWFFLTLPSPFLFLFGFLFWHLSFLVLPLGQTFFLLWFFVNVFWTMSPHTLLSPERGVFLLGFLMRGELFGFAMEFTTFSWACRSSLLARYGFAWWTSWRPLGEAPQHRSDSWPRSGFVRLVW